MDTEITTYRAIIKPPHQVAVRCISGVMVTMVTMESISSSVDRDAVWSYVDLQTLLPPATQPEAEVTYLSRPSHSPSPSTGPWLSEPAAASCKTENLHVPHVHRKNTDKIALQLHEGYDLMSSWNIAFLNGCLSWAADDQPIRSPKLQFNLRSYVELLRS